MDSNRKNEILLFPADSDENVSRGVCRRAEEIMGGARLLPGLPWVENVGGEVEIRFRLRD